MSSPAPAAFPATMQGVPRPPYTGWRGIESLPEYVAIVGLAVFLAVNLIHVLSIVCGFITRLYHRPRKSDLPTADTAKSLTILIPAYLPNEEGIILGTLDHVLRKLEYPRGFTVMLCYNTPHDLEIEKLLWRMDGLVYPGGKELRVLRVEGSTSKSKNLNEALKLVDTENIMIYDADHHPRPESLLLASAALELRKADCVQGSTLLRSKKSLLAWVVHAEFFLAYFVFFPALEWLSTGFFGGSNGLWKAEVLKSYGFDEKLKSEDLDVTYRVLLSNKAARFVLIPECVSEELPPAGFMALWRQRLRWTIGWEEISAQLPARCWESALRGVCGWFRRARLLYLFWGRYPLLLVQFSYFIFEFVIRGAWIQDKGGWTDPEMSLLKALNLVSAGLVGLLVLTVFASTAMHLPWRQWAVPVIWMLCFHAFIVWQFTILIVAWVRLATGARNDWTVTQRQGAEAEEEALLAASHKDSKAASSGVSSTAAPDGTATPADTDTPTASLPPTSPSSSHCESADCGDHKRPPWAANGTDYGAAIRAP